MTTDTPPPRRKWHFNRWPIVLIVAMFGWSGWRAYAFRSALSQAKVLGWTVKYTDPNGPGEIADADFGYVGGAPNKINLYVGKKPVKFNIPQDETVERLKELIKEHRKWGYVSRPYFCMSTFLP